MGQEEAMTELTTQAAHSGTCPSDCSPEIQQTIYEHGGSRIWREIDGRRDLIADTFQSREYAEAVRDFTATWFQENAEHEPRREAT
jgi:hypothetical protein